MAQIDKLFQVMVAQNASDMHLSSGAPPILRIHGEMVRLEHPSLTNENVQALIFEILNDKQKRQFVEQWELDCSYAIKGLGRFRVNVFMQRRGMGGVFRVIPEEIKTVHELGLPESLLKLVEVPRGLILVTGPTGSGKSTTLAALLHTINCERKEHILTIEDPIEFVHENRMCLINQREVTSHTKSFANALKAALREDPDIILVGEMRDLETIHLAMTAAETGHLVFGTLHTNSAAKTVDRIIDVFPQGQQAQVRVMLAESLRGVVAQTLFPRADKPGRVAALEVLVNTHAVGNLIREGKTFQIPSAMQTGSSHGMLTFDSSIRALMKEGKISVEEGEIFLGIHKDAKKEESAAPSPSAAAPQQRPPGQPGQRPPGGGPPGRPPGGGGGGGVKITSTSASPPPASSGAGNLLKNFGFKKKAG
ncbi:MAG: type IV pilus twitching motility protein PilT [Bdellovibrionaceae bacterium]|nr:type IV pilus twitching motility protein PilT [Bdellovibrionales bacterium]MCB9085510.1 type IV pilus twitching motility protein PilT [Pseudobdellovibrionaceae bacterium]